MSHKPLLATTSYAYYTTGHQQKMNVFYKNIKALLVISLLLVSFLFNAKASKVDDSQVAATIGNEVITYQMLDQSISDKIYQAEKKIYDMRLLNLKNKLLMRFIARDPLSQGITPETFINQFVIKDKSVSQKEVDDFIKKNKIPQEKIDAGLKAEVKQYLESEKERKAVSAWFARQVKKHGVVIQLKEPQKPKIEIAIGNAPVLGNKEAPITIVEYSDFQCPYCAAAEKTVKALLKKYPEKVKLVYKNFPLSFHTEAFMAAEAGLCAQEQSEAKFWQLHDKMFANPKKLKNQDLKDMANNIGLDQKRFNQCLDTNKYAARVQQEMRQARTYGVNSTPVFFINGVRIVGNQSIEMFEKIIEIELSNLEQ